MNKHASMPLDGSPVCTCANCGESFTPRGPGKPQKFCSPACRRAFHDHRSLIEGPAAKRGKRGTFETGSRRALVPVEPEKRTSGQAKGTLLAGQIEVTFRFSDDGDLVLEQFDDGRWEFDVIVVGSANIDAFLENLLAACGLRG